MTDENKNNEPQLFNFDSNNTCSNQNDIHDPTNYDSLNWTDGFIKTSIGNVPRVKTVLEPADKLGTIKVRFGIGRMKYRITPGLYAAGEPSEKSPVFISANYKLSFDYLRSSLDGIDSWIIVLDTKGINVWCAAGKGTFGTDEIIKQVQLTRLRNIVTHNRLIAPQLGAPGIAAHTVKAVTGFRVIYGPIKASDIKEFITNNNKATPEMRLVKFGLLDRLVLIPNDYVQNLKYFLYAALFLVILSGFGDGFGFSLEKLLSVGLFNLVFLLATYTVGMIFPQALLPWLPGKPFALKGFWIALIWSAIIVLNPFEMINGTMSIGWILMSLSIISFIAMNFTGSSTYTSLSGVKKEMKVAVPFQIGSALIGLAFWFTALFK